MTVALRSQKRVTPVCPMPAKPDMPTTNAASVVLMWVCAMCWHLWRIATLRPAFKHLGNTGPVVCSFVAMFYLAGILRHHVLMPESSEHFVSLQVTILALTLQLALVWMIFEKRDRSSALSAAILGTSAVVDLSLSALFLVGLLEEPRVTYGFWLEAGLAGIVFARFMSEPPEVQASTYKRGNKVK